MSRKTHPISHRLGITMWWPSRTPQASRAPITGNREVKGRGGKITELLRGILMKYGYKIATPNRAMTATSTGRIVMLVKRDQEARLEKKRIVANPSAGGRKTEMKTATTIPTYIMSYVGALVAEYEQKKYRVELREQQTEYTQGTAEQMAQKITSSEKSVIPTMVEIQRRVTKSQAYVEQQQSHISKKDRV